MAITRRQIQHFVYFLLILSIGRCASLRLDLPTVPSHSQGSQHQPRVIEARMTFADTEVSVSAVDTATGQSVNASMDFFDA
jgi:hypothetical protein